MSITVGHFFLTRCILLHIHSIPLLINVTQPSGNKANSCFFWFCVSDRGALIPACCSAAPPPPLHPPSCRAPVTRQHLETIRVNKRAAEELKPRSAFSASPQDTTHRATLNYLGGLCVVHFHMCKSVSAHICASTLMFRTLNKYLAWQRYRRAEIGR